MVHPVNMKMWEYVWKTQRLGESCTTSLILVHGWVTSGLPVRSALSGPTASEGCVARTFVSAKLKSSARLGFFVSLAFPRLLDNPTHGSCIGLDCVRRVNQMFETGASSENSFSISEVVEECIAGLRLSLGNRSA